MTLLASEALTWISTNTGDEAPDEGIVVINDAAAHLSGMHGWRWLVQVADLDTVQDVEYAGLPADFRALLREVKPGFGDYIEVDSIENFTTTKANSLDTGIGTRATVRWDLVSGNRVPRLYLDPTPSETASDVYRIVYRGSVTEVAEPSDPLSVPYFCRPLFRELVAAFWRGYQEPDGPMGPLDVQLERIHRGRTFATAVKVDAGVQSRTGAMRNGMVRSANRPWMPNDWPARIRFTP